MMGRQKKNPLARTLAVARDIFRRPFSARRIAERGGLPHTPNVGRRLHRAVAMVERRLHTKIKTWRDRRGAVRYEALCDFGARVAEGLSDEGREFLREAFAGITEPTPEELLALARRSRKAKRAIVKLGFNRGRT
jgi:hypothetical protein